MALLPLLPLSQPLDHKKPFHQAPWNLKRVGSSNALPSAHRLSEVRNTWPTPCQTRSHPGREQGAPQTLGEGEPSGPKAIEASTLGKDQQQPKLVVLLNAFADFGAHGQTGGSSFSVSGRRCARHRGLSYSVTIRARGQLSLLQQNQVFCRRNNLADQTRHIAFQDVDEAVDASTTEL